ncbi:MAG: hypothetical protein EBS69_09695 [Verrucomicrobia bacterium]|nr:hypothetical protein [Verrucomicrobiota bacterium]
MTYSSQATPEFWELYRALPKETRQLARKNYRLWIQDPFHPSLRFKKVGSDQWSVRIGSDYRALGAFLDDLFVWDWIGSHQEYDQRLA